ncbi:MAG: TonB-dependent receptor [Bacteroidota bacterium]|nr:TonB-dependent receptor [Bacteroidota bacterium]
MKRKKIIFLLLICCFTLSSHYTRAQNPPASPNAALTVSGVVSDENGKPLPGITVQVKGTSTSTLTGADGAYRIALPKPNSILVFSYVGYQTLEIGVNNRMIINTSMELSTKALSDVVVIGYGSQSKRDVTGAVSSFDARKLEERPLQRIDQALVGQLAGVTVKQTTGIPGKAFSIQVRGTGSISGGNEPLYVIDGFPLSVNSSNTGNGTFTTGNPLDNINPNDIERIEVLKDAAAAAIYGSRASNGVVIITTKRGQSGRTKINFNTYAGYNAASKKLTMLNGDQWIDRATEMINAAYVLKYGSAGATANDDAATRAARIGLAPGQINTAYMLDPRWAMPGHPGLEFEDWQNVIERKGQMQNYEVSASGGTDIVKYFISGNYANQDGFIVGVGYKAYSLRANIEVNASRRLKFGVNVAPTYSITQDPGVEGKDAIFHQSLSMTPVQEDTVGSFPNIGKNATYFWSNSLNGPLGKLTHNIGTTRRYRTLGTVYGEYQIIKGLNFRSSLNLDNTDNITTTYVPYIKVGTLAARTFTGSNNLLAATSGTYTSYRRQTFVNENTLTYNTVINDVHSLNILAGYSYNLDRLDRVGISSSGGFTNAAIQTINAAAAVVLSGTNGGTKSVLESYFSRVQYGYKDKYLLSASLRSDGSSRFGINNQYGIFPSASVAWRIIEEKFMNPVHLFSDLKVRASYGVNGNNNLPNDYASIATIGSSGYVLGGTPAAVIGQGPNVLANPSLQWEKSQTFDIGLDFGIWSNRLSGSFDFYNKLNTKLLLNVQVPEVTGFQTYLTNVGSVRNIGQELELSSRNLVGRFQWNTTVNISHNTNKIVSLAPGQTQIIIPNGLETTDQILRVGQPLNSIYVVRQIGFMTQDDINKHVAVYGTGETVGDPKYQDLNGDGVITEADKQIVGHPNPDFTYGVTNSLHFMGFDLSVLIQGQFGGSIYSDLGRALTRTGQGFTDNAPESYTQRWRSPTDQGAGRFSKAYSTFGFVANTDWLYSSDYIRVRDITLGYDLKGAIRTNAIQAARIYLTLENFFGHDKYYNGLNPEAANTTISSNSSYPEAGDYGGLPLAKSFVIGINITL